jgi:hypothetical protein
LEIAFSDTAAPVVADSWLSDRVSDRRSRSSAAVPRRPMTGVRPPASIRFRPIRYSPST